MYRLIVLCEYCKPWCQLLLQNVSNGNIGHHIYSQRNGCVMHLKYILLWCCGWRRNKNYWKPTLYQEVIWTIKTGYSAPTSLALFCFEHQCSSWWVSPVYKYFTRGFNLLVSEHSFTRFMHRKLTRLKPSPTFCVNLCFIKHYLTVWCVGKCQVMKWHSLNIKYKLLSSVISILRIFD